LAALSGTATFKTICLEGADDCVVMSHQSNAFSGHKIQFYFYRQEIADAFTQLSAPMYPNIKFVKVDKASYDAMIADTEQKGYKYTFGENESIDRNLVLCGIAEAASAASILEASPISAFLTCMASHFGCATAFKDVVIFEEKVNSGELPRPQPKKKGSATNPDGGGPTIGPGPAPSGDAREAALADPLVCRNWSTSTRGKTWKEQICVIQ
jgi:hypothetical protein